MQKDEYNFLKVEIDDSSSSIPKYGKKKGGGMAAARKPRKVVAKKEKEVAEVLEGHGRDHGRDHHEDSAGLDLDELVKEGENLDGIIEDDEDYD